MKFVELTMPLNHQWMPDDVLPTSVKFFLGPKNHQEKGMVIGSDSGTCLTLPSVFEAFRRTARLDEVPLDKLVLRPATGTSVSLRPRKKKSARPMCRRRSMPRDRRRETRS